jgi:2-polyprenyl-6-methoxyphenol hydroxylase-like FAD-dependent oxidoreductase
VLLSDKVVSREEVAAALRAYAEEMLPRNLQEQTASKKSTFLMHRSLEEWRGMSSVAEARANTERKVWGKD